MFKLDKDLIIIDIETSGTVRESSVIQLGAIRFDKNGRARNESTFNQYIKPYTDVWDEGSYAVHGISKSFLQENGDTIENTLANFNRWAYPHRDIYLAQWSCGFDTGLLQEAYKHTVIKYPFLYRAWDVASIVRFYLAFKGYNTAKGLGDCARILGLNTQFFKAHDALADATMTALTLELVIRELNDKVEQENNIPK